MFKYSLFYRLLSSSWFLNWTVSLSDSENRNYYSSSYVYRWSSRIIDIILRILYIPGNMLNKARQNLNINSILGLLGILIFFLFTFDLLFYHSGLLRIIIDLIIAMTGILMAATSVRPGIWQGSLFFRVVRWWINND